ncbi:group 1 truncated hemoglobin [Neobacillus sp. CF12]|uniref:group I truncated hemoglobin n=1 Tax=Neobacillus sp. CF12 TaxID=3055864 RepID=UPI0025A2CC38|nr:group 1 truncated hemoglobin [Neobacillus sp. CF12]MDM5327021.1 group 1 truncated hemoglobin [Neobacillus sp. CF12]
MSSALTAVTQVQKSSQAQSTQTLFEKVGGEEAIAKVVDYFYSELVLKDETVNHFFIETDMEKQRRHQTKFISFALGGPNQYSGQSMTKAHQGMNLQPVHFNAIVKHLHDALAHFRVNEADIDTALTNVASLRDDILYK